MIRLDRNERLSPFPVPIYEEMMKSIGPEALTTYPDPTPLYRRAAEAMKLDEDNFFFTNGSDAALRMILQAFLSPGDSLVLTNPGYAMLGVYSKIDSASVVEISYNERIELDLDQLKDAIRRKPKVVALPNPDQPTGTVVKREALHELIGAAAEVGAVFVIDEAYYPFYPATAIDWIEEFPNLLVTRSFSKAYGLAGLRLGFMAGPSELVGYASRVRGLHEVNTVAVSCGSYLLEHPEVLEEYVSEVAAGREVLRDCATRLGLGFPMCHTNFQLLKCPGMDTARIVKGMKERGYLIKGAYRNPSLKECIRTTVGPAELMTRFAKDLESVIRSAGEAI